MKRYLLAAGLLVAAPAAAFAQSGSAGYGPGLGDWEATLSGSGTSNSDFNSHSLGVSGSIGNYAAENVLLGVRQSVNFDRRRGTGSDWNGSTRGFADYVFDFGQFRPYLGASLGGIYGDGVRETFAAGPEIGFKYYADQRTFIFAQTEYQLTFRRLGRAGDEFSRGIFQHAVGVGFNF